MAVVVEHEDVEALKKWGSGLWKVMERCTFCRVETRYWHNASNKPVCQSCAETKSESDLPARAVRRPTH